MEKKKKKQKRAVYIEQRDDPALLSYGQVTQMLS